jgi:glycosyltransferase involved in cell wall biosynthesis
MILMYHKVAPTTPTEWWVSVDAFYRQLCELQSYKVVTLDDYDASNSQHCVITFDGVYQNILQYAAPLLKRFGYPFELFITSDVLGKNNEFDAGSGEPEAIFTTEQELRKLVALGGRLQWHTRSHPHLPLVSDRTRLLNELSVPEHLLSLDPRGFRWFAYPHGEFTGEVKELARQKFAGAVSCVQGSDTDPYAFNRIKVVNSSSFKKASLGIIIPSYKYGHFLPEAIESALRQTRPVDRILIADDCSPDTTPEVGTYYAQKYPGKIVYRRNEKNLGIVANFNQAVAAIGTDYVCFLGADNRFRSDFIEKTSAILDSHERCAVAYTDYAMFGPLAPLEHDQVPADRRGAVVEGVYYLVHFPEFTRGGVASLRKGNFIHGSSLFRREAFQQIGGYLDTSQAEDHNLFLRMVEAGWEAKRAPLPLLEYRKHSLDQANARLISQAELNFYKELVREKDRRIAELSALVAGRASILAAVSEKVRALVRGLYSALPATLQNRLKAISRSILVACERCDHPVFRLRYLIPSGVRRKVGRIIWSLQKQYFP